MTYVLNGARGSQFRFFWPFQYWRYYTTPGERKYARELKVLTDAIDRRVDERQAQLASSDGSSQTVDEAHDILSHMLAPSTGDPAPSRVSIRRQLMTFLFAGHDTTANMLSWMLYYLCRHPEYAAVVRDCRDSRART